MLTFRLMSFGLICILLLISSIAAADPLIRACAKNAAHPDDSGNLGSGVDYRDIDGNAAKKVCLQAYQKFPSNGLVNTSLSRAYNKLGQFDASFKHASIAVQNDYPFGYYIMATHYSFGDGVPKSKSEANKWFSKGGNKGVAAASRALATNLLNGEGVEKDLTLASQWVENAIIQGNEYAEYTKGLIIEAQAEQQNIQSGDINAYLSLLKEAHRLVKKVDYHTDLNGSEALARINRKIEQQQPAWTTIIPAIPDIYRNAQQEGYPWVILPTITNENGQVFQATYVSVSGTVLALWNQFDKNNSTTQWYIDFDYRGSISIDSVKNFSVYYAGELNTYKPSKTYERIAFTEMSTKTAGKGQRAVGKIDYRAAELLMNGTDIVVNYWSKESESKGFNFPLNIAKNQSDAKSVIVALAANAKNITTTCCQDSAIKPFSRRYWSQRLSCENISTIREDHLSMNFFGPGYVNRTKAEVDSKKKELLAQCEEVRLPITFRKIETINIDGEEIDKELYDEIMRNAYFEKRRQEQEIKNQSN